MPSFVAALAGFVLIHVGLSATGLRGAAVRALGEWPYRGLFSLASAGLLAALILTYDGARYGAENLTLWTPPAGMKHATMLLVFLGFLLGVAGLLSPGPTFAGFEGSLKNPEPAKGAVRLTRHPFLWGAALWALGHLLSNGELAPTLLFGGLLIMVLLGTRSIDRKTAARDAEGWARFKAATSNIPLAAVIQRRNRFALGELWWRLALGAAAFAGVYLLHQQLFGVAPR